MFIAAKKGHIDCLCCLWSAGIRTENMSRDDNLLSGTTAGESFPFAIEMGIQLNQFTDWTIDTLLRCDNVECLSYLYRAGLELTSKMFVVAVEYRSKKCFHYLLDQNFPTTGTHVCNTAAGDNNLERYDHEKGLPIGVETCFSAARADSLSCLKYLHQYNCPWNGDACSAQNMHMKMAVRGMESTSKECFNYLLLHNCPGIKYNRLHLK